MKVFGSTCTTLLPLPILLTPLLLPLLLLQLPPSTTSYYYHSHHHICCSPKPLSHALRRVAGPPVGLFEDR